MKVELFKTEIDPQNARVSSNIDAYLETCVSASFYFPDAVIDDVNAVTCRTADNSYNYARLTQDGDNKKYYFFASGVRLTLASTRYDLTRDWWAFAVGNRLTPRVSGHLVRAHDFVDFSTRFYLPEQLKPDVPVELYGSTNICVTASYTIADDDTERNILVFAPAVAVDEETRISSYVRNMARATKIDDKDILGVNGMWLLSPWFVWEGYPEIGMPAPNNVLKVGGGTIQVFWQTDSFYKGQNNATIPSSKIGDEYVLTALSYGNFGTAIDIPFTGVWSQQLGYISHFDGGSGQLSVTLRYGDTNVDLLPSLSVAFASQRTNETQVSRALNDTLATVGGLLSIAGGVITGNPLAIGAGAVSTTATLIQQATRVNYHTTPASGMGFSNIRFNRSPYGRAVLYSGTHSMIQYYPSNYADVKARLDAEGYVGDIYVDAFALNTIPQDRAHTDDEGAHEWVWHGVFRRWDNPRVYCDGMPARGIAALTEMCSNGFLLYNDNDVIEYGNQITAPVDFRAWNVPKPW